MSGSLCEVKVGGDCEGKVTVRGSLRELRGESWKGRNWRDGTIMDQAKSP